jgi:hypothetical protein
MTTTIDPQEVTAALQELIEDARQEKDDRDGDEELIDAGTFAGWYGSLGDWWQDLALTRIQTMAPVGVAVGDLGHWSIERDDDEDTRPSGFEDHQGDCPICVYLEGVLDIHKALLDKPCPDCRRGPDGHHYRPTVDYEGDGTELLLWGEPHAWCKESWTRVEPRVALAGDVSECQVGDAYSARWVGALADDTFAMVTRTYYLVREAGYQVVKPLGYQVVGQTYLERDNEYLVCTDPDDPGGTEIRSAGFTVRLDSAYPAAEDLEQLADDSFEPEPGEWPQNMPDSPPFHWV